MEEAGFHLRCELHGHEEDVRSLCILDDGDLATGSRDKMIKIWKEDETQQYTCHSTLVGHTDYVSALAYAPPDLLPDHPTGTLISGSRDNSLILWDLSSATPSQHLKGHQYQITAVTVTPAGQIVSASLDKTLRVWQGGECAAVLQGHEAAVLSVMSLPTGDILSGSGDCTIRAWSSDGKCIHTIPAHSDSVRGLAPLPGIGAVSASHDSTLKVWTLAGENVAELVGHTALVYCVATSLEGAYVASGSEDNTAKIWTPDGACLQTLEHPGTVWAVAFLPNGDLVTACSDHVARVWSRSLERRASDDAIAALEAAIEARKKPAAAGGEGGENGGFALPEGLKLEDSSVLQTPGTRDGQTKIVKEGSAGVAYSWNAATAQWERIGEVVGGPDDDTNMASPGKKWYAGQEWDFVFDVDIADGAPPLKLALNADENPYTVAERFIEQEGLSDGFKDQIVQFILQNTATKSTAQSSAMNVDPFTGGSSYVPPPISSSAPGGNRPLVPLTTTTSTGVTGGGADPYTGAPRPTHLPATLYLQYDTIPAVDPVKKKVRELNCTVDPAPLSEEDVAEGGGLDVLLAALCGGPAAGIERDSVELLQRMLSAPSAALFPALDLARLAVLNPASAALLVGDRVAEDAAPGTLGKALFTACAVAPAAAANQQTALRMLCNCFVLPGPREWMRSQATSILTVVAECASAPGKNVRQGLATLLLNYAVLLGKLPGDEIELKTQILLLAVDLFRTTPSNESDTLFRVILAVGTLCAELGKVRAIARDLGLLAAVQGLLGSAGQVKEAAEDAEKVMKL